MVAVLIKSLKQANDIKDLVSAFIVPIDSFSINYENTFSLDDIKKLEKHEKDIFVIVNKNIHNYELDQLKQILLKLDKLNIKGIFFYDISIVNLKEKLNLKTDLVWSQEHLTTNYVTADFWHKKGVKYIYLSSELTKKESDEIAVTTKAKTFINVFGYLPMFTSKRPVVTNYLKHFNLDNKNPNLIYKEEKNYIIKETNEGVTIYSDYVLNALDMDFKNYDYLIFNSNYIDEEDFYNTLISYSDKIFPFNHGFFDKETIYRVKKNV